MTRAMPVAVDEPPEDRRRAADAEAEGRRRPAGARERAGLGAHEEDVARLSIPIGMRARTAAPSSRRDVRRPQDAGEALDGRHGALSGAGGVAAVEAELVGALLERGDDEARRARRSPRRAPRRPRGPRRG
jgi:hypothetical protein